MNAKKTAIAGVTGGLLLVVILFGLNVVMNPLVGYDPADFPGMRPMDDPLMLLFFLYPFVISFAAAYLYDTLCPILRGTLLQNGLFFGGLLLVIIAIPSNFAMYTSMVWPVTFYLGNAIWSIAGFMATGLLYAWIWQVGV